MFAAARFVDINVDLDDVSFINRSAVQRVDQLVPAVGVPKVLLLIRLAHRQALQRPPRDIKVAQEPFDHLADSRPVRRG